MNNAVKHDSSKTICLSLKVYKLTLKIYFPIEDFFLTSRRVALYTVWTQHAKLHNKHFFIYIMAFYGEMCSYFVFICSCVHILGTSAYLYASLTRCMLKLAFWYHSLSTIVLSTNQVKITGRQLRKALFCPPGEHS